MEVVASELIRQEEELGGTAKGGHCRQRVEHEPGCGTEQVTFREQPGAQGLRVCRLWLLEVGRAPLPTVPQGLPRQRSSFRTRHQERERVHQP